MKSSKRKYVIYVILMFVFLYPLGMDLVRAVTFNKSIAVVADYNKKWDNASHSTHYSILKFKHQGKSHFFASTHSRHIGDMLPIIYNPQKPAQAYIYTFSDYWVLHIIIGLVFSAVVYLLVFRVSSIW